MKIKKVISIFLIFIGLLTSSESLFGQVLTDNVKSEFTEKAIAKYSQDLSLEFRETFEITISGESKSIFHIVLSNPTACRYTRTTFRKLNYFKKKYLADAPCQKLFIDFCSLLI